MARTAKKKSTTASKPRRTAAQRAATAKLVALNKRRAGSKTAAKPAAKRRRTATAKAATAVAKKRPAYKRAASKAAAPVRVKYKRNPVAKKGGMVDVVIHDYALPVVTGAASGIGVDALWGKLKFIPLEHRIGKMRYLGKAALGIGAGIALEMAGVPRHIALDVARGPLLIQTYAATHEFLKAKVPALGLEGYDDEELNEVIRDLDGLGADLTPQLMGNGMDGLGFYAPAYDSAIA